MFQSRVESLRISVVGMLLASGFGLSVLLAQPAAPPPPKEYRVVIRYRIRADPYQRVPQYRALLRHLETIGFHRDPGEEEEADDPAQTRMTGIIAAANARRILENRYVNAILLMPVGWDQAAAGAQRVRVQAGLEQVLSPVPQALLSAQVSELMRNIGFVEAVGYDHRGHTRLVGTLPADQLEMLLEDLRWQGSGWLAPQVPVAELPYPIRSNWPVRVVEVLPQPPGFPLASEPPPPVPAGQSDLLKIDHNLRALANERAPVRMEVLLATRVLEEVDWRRALTDAIPGSAIEGELGPLITMRALPGQATAFAQLPRVLSVRLPRPAAVPVIQLTEDLEAPAEVLQNTGLDRLHDAGQRGRGVRVAVIDDDFRGYQNFLGKQMPTTTHYVDLTAACEPDVQPLRFPAGPGPAGHGTQCALAVMLAAPEADLTLVRVARDAPFAVYDVARFMNGEPIRAACLESRDQEIVAGNSRLQAERSQLSEVRRSVLENYGQDPATVERREAFFKRQAELDRQQEELNHREQRFLRLVQDLRNLRGIQIVACSLVWNDGYPVNGAGTLSRYLDEPGLHKPLWFQAVGDARGSGWTGLFRDTDGNGVMEFAPPGTPLKPDRWTSELNFLGWQPMGRPPFLDLPQGNLRVSIQWQEPHDPMFGDRPSDPYREPLADFRLLILRQRDPSGTHLPADDMEVVARSVGLPLRLLSTPTLGVYEQTVEFRVAAQNRYAVRIEGRIPPSLRPRSAATLPAHQTAWECWTRLLVTDLDVPAPRPGWPIFWDYSTALGNLGMPADAQRVVSVGAANPAGQPEPYTSGGPPLDEALLRKPNLLGPDRFALVPGSNQALGGSAMAASLAAGLSAAVLSGGIPPQTLHRELLRQQGETLRVPSGDRFVSPH
jgi:hypothetical protein